MTKELSELDLTHIFILSHRIRGPQLQVLQLIAGLPTVLTI